MLMILLIIYIISVIYTIDRYRFVSKKCKHLASWNHYSHIRNLCWMFVPIVNLIFLLEALKTISIYKKMEM